PITARYDIGGTSTKHPVVHGVGVIVGLIKIFEFNRPLHVFGGIGISILSVGVIIGIDVVNSYNASGFLPLGPSLIMILLFIIGTFTVLTGIILHSIAQLFSTLKTKVGE
ncbi:MAG: hypothetical protein KAT65_10145, partial [Methanophagales archaeon]|nr:hypothetical protein [Methanophagales archaeon]